MSKFDALMWLDIETTGLDPKRNQILEIAVAFTNMDGELILGPASNSSYTLKDGIWNCVRAWRGDPSWYDPVVAEMHTKNGLFDECRKVEPEFDAVKLGQLITSHIDLETTRLMLAGSSVHFDRECMRVHGWDADEYLSHRHMDLTPIKMILRGSGFVTPRSSDESHRAVNDVRADIESYRTFKRILTEAKEATRHVCQTRPRKKHNGNQT